MTDYIYLSATTPCNEPCAQVGSNEYMKNSKMEAHAYIRQLTRTLVQLLLGQSSHWLTARMILERTSTSKFFYDDEDQSHLDYMNLAERGCEK